MGEVTTIGLDLAKQILYLSGDGSLVRNLGRYIDFSYEILIRK